MGKYLAIKMIPKGPIREIPKATTLFGAIANAVREIYGSDETEKFIREFSEKAKISSAFPYLGEEYFLPFPLNAEASLYEIFKGDISKIKEAREKPYIPLDAFEKAIRLQEFTVKDLPYKKVEIPKVSLDRVSQDSSIYFWDAVVFKENGGLYFLYDGPKDIFEKYIVPAMNFLGDHGIGGKRTWGYGLFVPEITEVYIDEPQGNAFVTLSPMYPRNENSLILWKVEKIGGWSWGRRKPKVPMVLEGSVIRDDPGKMIELDLGLPFKVYVNGKAFPVRTEAPGDAL
ncbi:type III-A CRISPR-associated RAMP protein Csm4 [Pyrococcus kukulkanii]|uniref:type III-A CRISPR-associated RAMP protein Csm4 n=1 Tax=Pyrococcus kukulkanii TaxID=1609559 RepID=UPI00356B4750